MPAYRFFHVVAKVVVVVSALPSRMVRSSQKSRAWIRLSVRVSSFHMVPAE